MPGPLGQGSSEQRLAALEAEVRRLSSASNPAIVTTQQLRQDTAMARGAYAGYGIAQNDTYMPEDNVDAGHGLRVDYVVPGNFQRLITARLTIVLRAYRTYDQTSAAGLHWHYWVTSGAGTLNWTLGMDAGGAPKIGGAALPPPYGYHTSTENWSQVGGPTPSAFSVLEGYDLSGHTHAQVLGVTEGATATSVTIVFDGDNQNARFPTAPFTVNQIELDITPVITLPDKTYLSKGVLHTITLTPNGPGRIHAILRLTYFSDGSVPA